MIPDVFGWNQNIRYLDYIPKRLESVYLAERFSVYQDSYLLDRRELYPGEDPEQNKEQHDSDYRTDYCHHGPVDEPSDDRSESQPYRSAYHESEHTVSFYVNWRPTM